MKNKTLREEIEDWKTEYAEHDLDSLVSYWVKAYKFKTKTKVHRYEYFIDTTKNKIIIKLTLITKTRK